MSYTNGVGNTQNLFATETNAASSASQTERTASVSLSNGSVPNGPGSAAVDNAKLSGFGGALAQALSQSDVRMDKVSPLQQVIGAGTYNVPAADVAEKMIGSLLG